MNLFISGNKNTKSIANAPESILKDLKCINCKDILSCPPITFYPGLGNVCGRCPSNLYENPVRNDVMETMLNTYTFPCRNKEVGCRAMLKFNDVKSHENECKFLWAKMYEDAKRKSVRRFTELGWEISDSVYLT